MTAVVAPLAIGIADALTLLANEGPLIEQVIAARQAGVTADALVAAIKAATLALSDDAMRAELAGASGG